MVTFAQSSSTSSFCLRSQAWPYIRQTSSKTVLRHKQRHTQRNALQLTAVARREMRQPVIASAAKPTTKPTKYKSLLPPFSERETSVKQVSPGIWTFEQPMGYLTSLIGNPFPLKGVAFLGQKAVARMTVVRLRDGSLWVHSPVALTEQCETELRRLGRVSHVVLPCTSPEHWYYGPKLIDAFPEAQVWSAPELLTSEKGLPYFRDIRTPSLEALKKNRAPMVLSNSPPACWKGQFSVAVFNGGPLYSEVVFLHKSSGSLISSDLLLGVDDQCAPSEFARSVAKANGIYLQLGSPVVGKLIQSRGSFSRDFLNEVLAWSIKRVIPTHGALFFPGSRNPFNKDVKTAVRNALTKYLS
eukprot:CAMPEP_0198209786 /NCGR_PEP_ID=MMETSP1445-20131203/17729_1 /TAXON_ID=36898 /ORGANISM="Pyramimonas sp., Strain CCMP2087" /LENGTH=355 /DNA_ID=CAMNT_0043883665 /DNA_START=82 /DNA_END=1149 /DNA_ORIENTATION=+